MVTGSRKPVDYVLALFAMEALGEHVIQLHADNYGVLGVRASWTWRN